MTTQKTIFASYILQYIFGRTKKSSYLCDVSDATNSALSQFLRTCGSQKRRACKCQNRKRYNFYVSIHCFFINRMQYLRNKNRFEKSSARRTFYFIKYFIFTLFQFKNNHNKYYKQKCSNNLQTVYPITGNAKWTTKIQSPKTKFQIKLI